MPGPIIRRICIFAPDPLKVYHQKGEIKHRYYNPDNYFDEVHIISLTDEDVEPEKVQILAGEGKLEIHAVGAYTLRGVRNSPFLPRYRNRVLDVVRSLQPQVIRAYDPLVAGYLATWCGEKLGIPKVVSLHANYDLDFRYLWRLQHRYKALAQMYFFKLFIEGWVLSRADKVVCAYEFPVSYARRHGARDVEVIYNRVSCDQFAQRNDPALGPDSRNGKPLVLNVGRFVPEKNQQCLIRAMRELDAHLLLVGDGPQRENLQALAMQAGIEGKVTFVRSVPATEIHRYYASADIFASAITLGGIDMPSLEAMASGLPVVISRSRFEGTREAVGDAAILVENTPRAFANAFQQLIDDPELRQTLGERGSQRSLRFDVSVGERKEREMYEVVLNRR